MTNTFGQSRSPIHLISRRHVWAFSALTWLTLLVATASAATPQLEWSRTLGTSSYDFVGGVAADADGNMYICGGTYGGLFAPNPTNTYNTFLAKYDFRGSLLWGNQFTAGGGSPGEAGSVAVDAAGGVYVAASGEVHKYDSAGAFQWSTALGVDTRTIGVDRSGNVFVAGASFDNTWGTWYGGTDAFLGKLDSSSGTVLWGRQFGTANSDRGRGVAFDSQGNAFVAGYSMGASPWWENGFVTKFDTDGNMKWSNQIGPPSIGNTYTEADRIAVDSHDNLYVAGVANLSLYGEAYSSVGGSTLGYLMGWDTAGNRQWISRFNANGGAVEGLIADPLGGEYVLTDYEGLNKFNSSGNELWNIYGGSFQATDMALGNGRLWVIGICRGSGDDDYYDIAVSSFAVPEPSCLAIIGAAAASLALLTWLRRMQVV